ncbi:MAG TPA: sulfatase [Geminicoccaceae bacterium]|nr:sulfatase [Geminicoccus sp.]HMU48610.1 sulfatase [Geminicoccaceae bacterium]
MRRSVGSRALAALRALLVIVMLSAAGSAAAASRPNIVFILADDMDLAALQWMPTTRRLLGEGGTTFDRNYVEVALCAPSRATMLTGRYAHNHKVLTVDKSNGGFRQFRNQGSESRTVAVWLRNAGYATALVGKYINGFPDNKPETYIPPGWSYWAAAVQRGDTPYRQFKYKLNENGKLVSYGSSSSSYGTDVYTRRSIDFIKASAKAGKPFFLFLSLFAPHTPATAAPRHAGLFADATVPRTPGFMEADVTDKPLFLQYPELDPLGVAALDAAYAQRLRALQAVDEAVGKVYDAVGGVKKLSNTYFVFASDNGYHLGQHRLPAGKQLAIEEDIHLPLLIRGPGVPAGRVDGEHLVGNADLAPTFAEWAGVSVPVTVDGRSLAPLLAATPPAVWRQSLPLARWRIPTSTTDPWPEFKGVRTTRFSWVEWADGSRELYDNAADPDQLANLAADPALAPARDQLARLVADLGACLGATCRSVEDRPWVEPVPQGR